MTSEEFGLGGDLFLRAYDPSELIGDYGVAGKAELRYDLRGRTWGATFYGYHDRGRVSYRLPNTPSESAQSSGLGVRFSIPGGLHGYVEAAKPQDRIAASTGDDDVRIFGGLGVNF